MSNSALTRAYYVLNRYDIYAGLGILDISGALSYVNTNLNTFVALDPVIALTDRNAIIVQFTRDDSIYCK